MNRIASSRVLFQNLASMKSPLLLPVAVASLCAASLATFAANPGGFGPAAAAEQLKQLKVADGLAVGLYASEPMIRNVISMDVDARGRVWTTEGANYRLFQKWGKLRAEGDRIVILEDTNSDGAADNAKVFYQGNDVNSALGICVLGDKVIVSCSPNILLFEDKNGDDVADGPPKIMFSGIGAKDHDHGAHAFSFGPDGKLYFNIGNDAKQLKTADGKDFVVDKAGNKVNGDRKPYQQGLVFRCNLDGSELETLGWNFRNNFEVAVDSFGTLWQSDNDDDGHKGVRINYVMEFGNYGYKDEKTGAAWNQKRTNMEKEIPLQHWHLNDPGVVPNLLQTGAGSPTGITIYEGSLLPEVFRNQIIHCDAGPRAVRAYPVKYDGAGYSATIADVLTSEDTWYRPSDVVVALDGSLYISDWNDAGVGGHMMADQKFEEMTGRIYRVAPPGHKPTVPKLDLKTAKGAVAALQSPNNATRYLAWTALHEMDTKAESDLKKLWNGKDARQRARALHLLARIKGKDAEYVKVALKDKDSDLRITGLRIARERGMDLIPLVKQLAKDPSAQVRRECAIALRHSKSPEAPALWAALAQQHDGKDRWYLEALGIAADKNEDAYFNAWFAIVGDNWNTPAGRDLIGRARAKKCPELLVKILSDKAISNEEKPRYLRALDFLEGPEKEKALVDLLTVNLN